MDDEQEILELVASILNEDGFQNIKTEKTVKEAIAISETYHPEIAILDVMLPDGNGFHLMERLKSISDYPVLFLTARGEDEDKFRGFGLGTDDYMVKPFLPRELLFRVNAILRRSYKGENPLVKLSDSEIDFAKTILSVLAINIALILIIYVIANSKLLKSVKPIVSGIQALSTNEEVHVREKGILSELAVNINKTSDILRNQNRLLRKRETARANWIAGVSHDIRTPLSMVMGYAGQLESDKRLPEDDREKAEIFV